MRKKLSPVVIVVKTRAQQLAARHKVIVRTIVFVGIVVVCVLIHENTLTGIVVCKKAFEVFTDVCADRVFPASWFGGGES
jgi:hypothetical protein